MQDGGCLRAVQVREHVTEQSVCFHLMRSDGIVEDFSLNKCLTTLFPTWAQSRAAKARFFTLPPCMGSCWCISMFSAASTQATLMAGRTSS